MTINNVISSFGDVIKFNFSSQVNIELLKSSKEVQILAKAIQDHAYIKLGTNSVITINSKELEISPASLIAITGIVDKFKLNFDGLNKKLEALYQRALFTNDKSLLISIKKDVERLQQDVAGHQTISGVSRKTLQDKVGYVLEEIDNMTKAVKIVEILQKGKAMQGYPGEVLSYEDYQLVERIKIKSKTQGIGSLNLAEKTILKNKEALSAIEKSVKSVNTKLEKVRLFIGHLDNEKLQKMVAAVEAGTATKDQVKLVVNCKKLWMDLSTDEGSYLQILGFVGKEKFEGLAVIKEIAFMQGLQVDEALNQTILEEHFQNTPNNKPPMRVLIEGAGPNGLYAALQFFRSGSNITVVNDRGERVIRNQNIIIDPKWIAQLNFLLGSKFNELFGGPKAFGTLNPIRGSGTINTKILEDILKVRVAELSSYIEETQSSDKGVWLNLHFEAPLRDIQSSSEGFSAIFGQAKESVDTARFRKLGIDGLIKKIQATKYADYQPDHLLENGKTVADQVQEEAAAQWEKEQSKAKIEKPTVIPFDVLACVGGANDVIRDEFLDPAIPFTVPKNYGIASWLKPEAEKNKMYFSQENLSHLNVRTDSLGYPYLTREHIEEPLRSQELDQLLNTSNLPGPFKQKYLNFTEQLLENIGTTRLPNIEPDQHFCGFNIRTFENKLTVYLGASTPPLLADFLHELGELMAKTSNAIELEQLKKLKTEVDKRWMNSLAKAFEVDPKTLKMDDEYSINVGTFDVQQKGGDVAAKLLESTESSAVITTFGDSRASPHFFSGSGMSTGRLGVEDGAEVFRKFNRGDIRSKKEFVAQLSVGLDYMKKKVVEKGSNFNKPNPVSERMATRFQIVKNKVNEHFSSQQKSGVDIAKRGWKIETIVSNKGEFDLSFIDTSKTKQTFKVVINPEDGRLYARGKKYLVLNDLLVSLGVK